jgi:hypothetical protein
MAARSPDSSTIVPALTPSGCSPSTPATIAIFRWSEPLPPGAPDTGASERASADVVASGGACVAILSGVASLAGTAVVLLARRLTVAMVEYLHREW